MISFKLLMFYSYDFLAGQLDEEYPPVPSGRYMN